MLTTHAVGIDLGTTYSCIAYLNEHGEPVTLPNQEGELATPSVVMFDGDEVIVGTEALRNSIVNPSHVVQNSKRYMGDANHRWVINDKPYSPVDIATFVLKKLLSAAQEQIGQIDQAVITVPAQFSDFQRHATLEAGHRAGLQRVDIINEPVAAALCYVLGSEGLWFTELADAQRIMVYDLGGGTFDLSLVKYEKNEVSVIVSSGDLNLGGIDWNHALEQAICNQFNKEFGQDPRTDAESLQFLALEAEQTKRSLTARPRAALLCQHAGHRKTYQVELAQFEKLTRHLCDRTADITQRMLKDNKMGWAHVDVVLLTGGSSRMPMIRSKMKDMSGRTPNKTLSPDQSIAHGATYYAGMLLTNSKFAKSILNEKATKRLSQVKQRSVNARALGILVRDKKAGARVPYYLVEANTPLPTAKTHNFGTVVKNQRRVHLQIVESGTSPEQPSVKLGACIIEDLPPDLPENSEVAVTISYDAQAKVHVAAKDVTSGKYAHTEIIRQENLVPQLESKWNDDDEDVELQMVSPGTAKPQAAPKPRAQAESPAVGSAKPQAEPRPRRSDGLEEADRPVPLCNKCGEPLNHRGECTKCGTAPPSRQQQAAKKQSSSAATQARRPKKRTSGTPKPRPVPQPAVQAAKTTKRPPSAPPPLNDDEILELGEGPVEAAAKGKPRKRPSREGEAGEDEFWKLVE